jgi:hypothetical protein
MSNGDKNFEEYLAGKSTVSEKYAELGDIDPPAELDAVILAEAERAAKTHSHEAGKRSWVIPVSVAATVMICFSLVLNILREVPSGTGMDQGVDAIIPADSFDAPASLESLSSKARPAAPAEKKEIVVQDSFSRQAESPQVLLQGLEESRGRQDKDDGQVRKSADLAAPARTTVFPDAISPIKPRRESLDAPVGTYMSDARQMEEDELVVLGQMMEVVTDYLNPEQVISTVPGGELLALAQVQRSDVTQAEDSTYSDLASLSVDEKSNLPAPEQEPAHESDFMLRRIVELYSQNENIAAAEALDEFRRTFPDHAVSRLLLERGY